jgi:hypothetical protein
MNICTCTYTYIPQLPLPGLRILLLQPRSHTTYYTRTSNNGPCVLFRPLARALYIFIIYMLVCLLPQGANIGELTACCSFHPL